jgi:hypothetical protein
MKWDPSHAFLRLLITQVALILVYPLLGEAWGTRFLLGGFLMLSLYGGIIITVAKPFRLWTSLILGVSFIGCYWAAVATDIQQFQIWSGLFGAAFFWFIAIVMMQYIFFNRSRVDTDLIYGAISAYLLIGSGFGEIYLAFAKADPQAFSGIEITSTFDGVARSLNYYSFVTLTTLGYGDITPGIHYTKVLAYTEAIVGQLYLTILVARLVGAYIAQSRNE